MKIVYRITIAHKFYYGSTIRSLSVRKWEHLTDLKKGSHVNSYMQNAYDKYQDFNIKLVASVPSGSDIIEIEQLYIDKYIDNPDCMNIAPIAGAPMAGRTHTEESKAKMSAAKKGKKHTEETKAKMSAAALGRQAVNRAACYGRPKGTSEWMHFESRSAAALHIQGSAINVSRCISGKRRSHKGWEFKEIT